MNRLIIVTVLFLLLLGCTQPATTKALSLKGSDTELQMFAALAEEFMQGNPGVSVTVTGGGSGTGIAALINKEVDVADSSRPMKAEEVEQARKNGVEPVEFVVARDGLAIIVNPSNLVNSISLRDLADVYTGKKTNWKELGGEDKTITLYGRQSTSGTYVYFRDTVLKDDYARTMRNMEGNAAIADAVAQDSTGIGYIGLGYVKEGMKVLQLEGVTPTDMAAVVSGKYALTRPLYQYTKGVPAKDSATHRLLAFEVSPAGQKVVEESGFLSLFKEDIAANQKQFGRIN